MRLRAAEAPGGREGKRTVSGSKARDLAYMAFGTALMAVCSWISIPAAVPFTMQTFALIAVLDLLGRRRGLMSVAVYLLLGLVGVPVFAGFSGGPGALMGPTGGYLLGFLLSALVFPREGGRGRKPLRRAADAGLGLAVCYVFGTLWFMLVYTRQSGPVSVGTALAWCVWPFLLPDLAKAALALGIAGRVRKICRL